MTKEEIVNEAKKVFDNLETSNISLRLDVLITRNKKSLSDFKEIERLVSSGKALIELKTSLESKKSKTMEKNLISAEILINGNLCKVLPRTRTVYYKFENEFEFNKLSTKKIEEIFKLNNRKITEQQAKALFNSVALELTAQIFMDLNGELYINVPYVDISAQIKKVTTFVNIFNSLSEQFL